ncbi:MAG: LLM class flavin-dependent oxidoreductase [Gammaproteobacteria bacterium]|nr:LLM class flavin-dependent oxidoreductase [Gammaproteobacteria bacterium]
MKFGVLQFFSWPGRRVPLPQVYERAWQRIDIMEHSGYDAVWLAEHHFSTYSVCPSIHMMGAHIAARTTRLRIGMGVSLPLFYHPLRLAEEVALLDVISGGRVNWGAGRGFDAKEYATFGIARDDSYPQFREHLDVVLKAWTEERLTYHGEYCDYDDVEVLPKPLQEPHPPVWVAASSLDAIAWSAAKGFSILMDPHASHEELGAKRTFYAQALKKAGYCARGRDIPMARNIALGRTEEEAEATARRGAEFMFGSYLRKPDAVRPAQQKTIPGAAVAAADASPQERVDRYVNEVVICGTPEQVIDELQRLEETLPLDYLLCTPLSHSSFMLFTEEVLPAFL